eukprot:13372461-Alexandrium_andersonii.AAC.1
MPFRAFPATRVMKSSAAAIWTSGGASPSSFFSSKRASPCPVPPGPSPLQPARASNRCDHSGRE